MTTTHPAFIVAEIPEPVRCGIQGMRDQLATPTRLLPVEITLAGSSGTGPIPPGTPFSRIIPDLERIVSGTKAFVASFSSIAAFPGTSTAYLAPADRTGFDLLHLALRNSPIPFSPSAFPYTPHCTLRSGPPLSASDQAETLCMNFPRSTFRIGTLSLYEHNASTSECLLLWQGHLMAA